MINKEIGSGSPKTIYRFRTFCNILKRPKLTLCLPMHSPALLDFWKLHLLPFLQPCFSYTRSLSWSQDRIFRLDINLVSWYYSIMQTVATNIRFPADEYQQLRMLAFLEKRPISELIRDSVRRYKTQASSVDNKRIDLFRLMVKSRVKINIPTLQLVADGRRI